jgi:hypothetical protein
MSDEELLLSLSLLGIGSYRYISTWIWFSVRIGLGHTLLGLGLVGQINLTLWSYSIYQGGL